MSTVKITEVRQIQLRLLCIRIGTHPIGYSWKSFSDCQAALGIW